VALGKGAFACPAVQSGLCRVFPLGRGCAERKAACAESTLLSTNVLSPIVVRYGYPWVPTDQAHGRPRQVGPAYQKTH
jgi:hypothetical protein